MKIETYIKKCFVLLILLFGVQAGFAQVYDNFDIRYQNNIRGELTFISNNILNRDGGTSTTEPNDAYDNLSTNGSSNPETGGQLNYNDFKDMQYIDVDNDPSTFSSSTSTLTFPQANCNAIRYAGLYWTAKYPSATANGYYDGNFSTYRQNDVPVGTGRQNDFDQVKFKVPGGSYVDIVADEVIYDGFTSADPNMRDDSPYACYADVTSLLTGLANPEGDYTVANVRSVTGYMTGDGGASAGWTLIIVYENPTLSGKLITTFDGFALVNGTNSVDIQYSGFNTIPVGPVNADIGVAALEGDFRIGGDGMSIRADSNLTFTTINNATNPANNFFNSNITLNGVVTTNRDPASINTLGYDTDMFLLNNPSNSVIPNGETDATFRFSTNGDTYYPFFNSFSVEIIEPNIVLEKRVEDIAGNDITGAGVNLGQYLDYVLSYTNIGNDDATNYTIRDILPINVTLDTSNISGPTGMSYVYDPANREITFTIPDYTIEAGDPIQQIRMRVQVAENCFDFIDACSTQIENVAFSTYQGVINTAMITDDPSVNEFNNCGFSTPGATNFLLDDLDSCDFSRTVQLCGENVLLDAGDNFDAYIWYRDNNEDGLIDAGDTVINDGDPDNDPSTFLVDQIGTYIVDKQVADPCLGFQEIITVIQFGTIQSNPISALINDTSNTVEGQVLVCPNDGEELPEIFLCGINDTELLQINIPDAQSIEWEQLDEASCAAATQDCANKDNGCTWNNITTGNDFLAQNPGEYRMVVNYQNGCFSRFYFNIYQNPLDPQYTTSDIICTTPGNITITNMPVDYEYQLLDGTTNNILVPYNSNPSFDIATNGDYSIEMRQQGVVGGCIFRLENIGILQRNFQANVTTRDTDCNGLGEISISALGVEPQYYYEISQGGVSVDTHGPTIDNNYTFTGLNDGTYDILLTTDDGCSYTEQVTINDLSDLDLNARVSQHITCREGNIQMESTGGRTPHTYAIWSYIDDGGNTVISYPTVNDIPPSEYQTSVIFDILDPGQYTFVVVDRNNCFAISNPVDIEFQPSIEYTTSLANETCFESEDGSFTVNVTSANGYSVSFLLTYPDGSTSNNTSGVFTGLGSGGYVLTINQRKGNTDCDFIETFSIGGPTDPLIADAVLLQDDTCLQDGIIEAQNVTGGTPPYEFSIDGINFNSGFGAETFSGLNNGAYTITVRDSNGCTFDAAPVTIDPFTPPSDLVFTTTAPTCANNSSDVTAQVSDGEGPYTFEIISPSAIAPDSVTGDTASFNGLVPDTYTFRVTDANGCFYEENLTIAPVAPISVVGQLISNVTCLNDTDGEILFTVSGFSSSYDYSVSGPSTFSGTTETSTTIPLNGLDDGTYTITVTDTVTGCVDTAALTVNAPSSALTVTEIVNQPTCTADGSVNITATGGWGAYLYEISAGPGGFTPTAQQSNGLFSGLTLAGTYTYDVTDANGCVIQRNFTLDPVVAPVLALSPNSTCYDSGVGLTLTATVTSGGDGNFEYRINGGAFSSNNVFSGLGPGTYTVDVRDGKDCTDTQTITVEPELTITASASNVTSCGTDTDIDISAAGGDTNYVYAVVADGVSPVPGDFGASNTITITGAGDYDVYVRDNNGNSGYCEATFDIAISQDPPLAISPTVTDVTCFGASDGRIDLVAGGGESPYQFSIDNGTTYQVSGSFVNLSAGTYPVRLQDANGCETNLNVIINEPNQLAAEAAISQTYDCTQLGEITVGGITPTSGGSGDYQYSLNGGAWTPSTTGGTTFTGLVDGTYTVTVRDANAIGCTLVLPDLVIAPLPAEPTLSHTLTNNCDGSSNVAILPNDPSYTYALNAGAFQASNVFNNVAVGTHTFTVDYGSNCTVDTTVIVEPGNELTSNIINFTNPSCNAGNDGSITIEANNFGGGGFEYSLDGFATTLGSSTTSPITIGSLTAGPYTISVRDVDNPIPGCTVTLNQTLTQPANITVNNTLTQPTCEADGSVVITASGGSGGYTYEIEQPDTVVLGPQSGNVFGNLSQYGLHTITVTDANGCTATDTFTTVAPVNPTASIDATSNLCYSNSGGATVVVGATGGVPPYTYRMNTGTQQASNTFSGLVPGVYNFRVTDSYGCFDDISFTIEPQLTTNLVLTKDKDCTASPDAVLTLNVNGGYPAYTYELQINGGAYASYTGGLPYTTMTAGTYRFRVTDSEGCIAESNVVTVSDPVDPQATATVTDPNCNGESNGVVEINVDPNFGISPYEISFDTGPFTSQTVYPGLAAGTYLYTVRDANGCTYDDSVTLTDPALFTANVTPYDVTCSNTPGGGDIPGRIEIDIPVTSGGVPNFTYTLYDNLNNVVVTTGPNPIVNTPSTNVVFDGLAFGDYYVRILDANGCEYYENPVRVLSNPYLTLSSNAIADCATGGTVQITADSGSGNYTFSIFGPGTPPDFVTPGLGTDETATFSSLNSGQTYVFEVIDDDTGCSSYIDVPIPSLSSIAVVADPTVTDVTCNGDTDGSIAFQIEAYDGLVTDINYEIREALTNNPLGGAYSGTVTGPNGPGPTPVVTIPNIPPGDYELYFEEATSPFCSNVHPFRILEPNPITLNLVDQNNGNCNEDANVTVLAGGGHGGFTYAFVEDGVAPVAGDYGPSNYAELDPATNTDWDVHVLDANGCSGPVLDITIADDPTPFISSTVNQCVADEGDFVIEITLDTAGVGPYDLSLNGGAFQSSTLTNAGDTYQFNNLSSGNYTVEIRDSNSCGNLINITIETPPSITAEVTTQPSCIGNDGEVLITAYGGSGVYLYELFDSGSNSVGGGPQISPIFTGLGPDVYTAFIYDQLLAGCDASVSIALEVPQAVSFTTSPTDVTCFGASDGSITATLSPGMSNPPYTYQLFDSTGLIPVTLVPQASPVFTGLAANTYTVRVYSGRLCQADELETVGSPAAIANVNASVVEFGCTTGNSPNSASITVLPGITGGTGTYVTYEFIEEDDPNTVPVEAPVVVQSGSNSTFVETDFAGGVYTINVYDENGCIGTTTSTIQPFDELLAPTLVVDDIISCTNGGEDITITANSTLGTSTFEFRELPSGAFQASGSFTNLASGSHNFEVRNVDTGCIRTIAHTVAEPNTFNVTVDVLNDVVCFGSQTGQISFELTDAVAPPYTTDVDYTIYDSTSAVVATGSFPTTGPNTIPQLLFAGSYTLEVVQTNFPECTNVRSFNIAGPDAPISANTVETDITCLGNDGEIEIINTAGGWGAYQYYVGTTPPTGPGDYVASTSFTGLGPGVYEAWVIDSSGCEEQVRNNINLVNPNPISATLQINNENCTNIEGEIEVVGVTGGQNSNYTYQLIRNGSNIGSPQTNPVFSNLGEGTYEVLIADQWSCTFTTIPVELYDEMTVTSTVVKPIDCTVTPEGEITIAVNGGSGAYDFVALYPDGFTTMTINNSAIGVFAGLPDPGTYTFTVTDINTNAPVCTRVITQDLTAPTPVTFDPHTIVDVSCNGGADGSITVNLAPTAAGVNDDPAYTFNLYDAAGTTLLAGPQGNPTFVGLAAGQYQVEAVSSKSCSLRETVTVGEPAALTIDSVTASPFACAADNTVSTSTITITVSGGVANYLYSMDGVNYQTSNVFDVPDTGVIQSPTIYVVDANGCSTTSSVNISPINDFTATVTQNTAITCLNPEEVLITINDDGTPSNSYTFDLLPIGNLAGSLISNPSNTEAIFNLTEPGSYVFRITDNATGCYIDTAPYDIAPYDLIEVDASVISPVVCFGDGNGALEITISGYTGAYDYTVYDQANNLIASGSGSTSISNPQTINGLSGGNYYVEVTETDPTSSRCTANSGIVTIESPDVQLQATPVQVASVTCTNDQGEIAVTPTGGYAPYDLVLTNLNTLVTQSATDVMSFVFNGLSADDYEVSITDATGCTITESIQLLAPQPIVSNINVSTTTLACYGDTNASVWVDLPTGGSGSYQYQLNVFANLGDTTPISSTGFQTSNTFNNLGSGVYGITISDGWNCDAFFGQVEIAEPTEVEANLIQTAQLTCNNQAEIELSATGGSAPYDYSVDGISFTPMSGGNSHSFTVGPGTYQYFVRDAQGCISFSSNAITIDPIEPLQLFIDDSAAIINCTGEASASLRVSASGGLGNYTYELFTDAALTNLVAGPQSSELFSSLTAGSYYIRTTSVDCSLVSSEIIIENPDPLVIEREEFTDVTCNGANDGSITVEVSGGSGDIFYAISPNLNQFDDENTFTGLEPGTYELIAQDSNGCFLLFQFIINEPAEVEVSAINVVGETCAGNSDGMFDLEITGGTAPYETSLDSNADADFVPNQINFANIAPGTHVVFVRDAEGCETNVFVEIEAGVNLNATVNPIYTCTGNIPENALDVVFEDPSVMGEVLYALDSTDPADMQLTSDFTNMAPGSHYLTIAHSNGCINTIDFEILDFDPLTLVLEQNNINEITAVAEGGLEAYTFYFDDVDNGDDNTYIINRTDTYTVRVVDQNNCEVSAEIFMEFIDIEIPDFFTPNGDGTSDGWKPNNLEAFPNTLTIIYDRYGRELYRMELNDAPWNGMYQGNQLPTGDYWYVIRLRGENDDREFVGHFTLYR